MYLTCWSKWYSYNSYLPRIRLMTMNIRKSKTNRDLMIVQKWTIIVLFFFNQKKKVKGQFLKMDSKLTSSFNKYFSFVPIYIYMVVVDTRASVSFLCLLAADAHSFFLRNYGLVNKRQVKHKRKQIRRKKNGW